MKKLGILILLLSVCTISIKVNAQTRKLKKRVNKEVSKHVIPPTASFKLKTQNDSINYTAGYIISNDLEKYAVNQLKLNSKQIKKFKTGVLQVVNNYYNKDMIVFAKGVQAGLQIVTMLQPQMANTLNSADVPIDNTCFYNGLIASINKDTTMFTQQNAESFFDTKIKKLSADKLSRLKADSEKFMQENKKKSGIVSLPSGLQYKVIVMGKGKKPNINDKVEVSYEGRTTDGKIFDATVNHNVEYDTFGVGKLIKGWTEALQLMPEGSTWELYIPYYLAYNERGAGRDIPPYANLIFNLTLNRIVSKDGNTTQDK